MLKIVFFLFLSVLYFDLSAAEGVIDHSARTFEIREKKRERVDLFDFSGAFVNLEKIDIDARRKKNVELLVTGDFPLLEKISYEGTFGLLKGSLTGNFSLLEEVSILCTNCAMELDLKGHWEKSCEIVIRGGKENITLLLPEEVGIIVKTKTAPKGKVILSSDLKKKGFGIWKKKYMNPLAETAPIVLTISIESSEGAILLK